MNWGATLSASIRENHWTMTCKQNQSSFLHWMLSGSTRGRPATQKNTRLRAKECFHKQARRSSRLHLSKRLSVTLQVWIGVNNSWGAGGRVQSANVSAALTLGRQTQAAAGKRDSIKPGGRCLILLSAPLPPLRGRGRSGSRTLKIMEGHVLKYVAGNYSERRAWDHDEAPRCARALADRLVLIKKTTAIMTT